MSALSAAGDRESAAPAARPDSDQGFDAPELDRTAVHLPICRLRLVAHVCGAAGQSQSSEICDTARWLKFASAAKVGRPCARNTPAICAEIPLKPLPGGMRNSVAQSLAQSQRCSAR